MKNKEGELGGPIEFLISGYREAPSWLKVFFWLGGWALGLALWGVLKFLEGMKH